MYVDKEEVIFDLAYLKSGETSFQDLDEIADRYRRLALLWFRSEVFESKQ